MHEHLKSSMSGVTGTISADLVQPKRWSPKFIPFTVLLTLSLVGIALFIKRSHIEYDSSGKCLIDNEYTEITKTEGSSTTHSYRVNYRFETGGQKYSGTDEIPQEPTEAVTTVYFTAAQPQENSLHPMYWSNTAMILAGIALVVALIAYWKVPIDYFILVAGASRKGIGDSGLEHTAVKRGKYSAWAHVEFAFFGQIVLIGFLVARLLSVIGVKETGDVVIIIAGILAVSSTMWVYYDRWRCIEAYSSRFCSGIANLSMFYVPLVALIYANYRALKRLQGH
jgi:hypothetical protein